MLIVKSLLLSALTLPILASFASASSFTTLYRFDQSSQTQGTPNGSLTVLNGLLYGTTGNGGSDAATGESGTVFSVNPTTGAEATVASFSGGKKNGFGPNSGLLPLGGQLYGTTLQGYGTSPGSNGNYTGYGTLYRVNPATGAEAVVHGFQGHDGSQPEAGGSTLVADGGFFYGTTWYGGAQNTGTVFKISRSGHISVLYQFPSSGIGCNPVAGVSVHAGILYGTTNGCGQNGYGTVFSLDLSNNAASALYSFPASSNAPEPGRPIYVDGSLIGTTLFGGSGFGTVYKIELASKTYTLLHSFSVAGTASANGYYPIGDLIASGTTVYGVGESGTIFTIDIGSGHETVLYNLSISDGTTPFGGLVMYQGSLYGTTTGAEVSGQGTVFKFTP